MIRACALLVGVGAWGLLGVTPATASCADRPEPSPHAFIGTVLATSDGGRIAEVETDDGERVTVRGGEESGWFSGGDSSTDRQYAEGGRYEFHPVDDESPYWDNACTATRQLSGPRVSHAPERSAWDDVLPAWLPVDGQAGPAGVLLVVGPLVAGLVGLLVVARKVARRRASSG